MNWELFFSIVGLVLVVRFLTGLVKKVLSAMLVAAIIYCLLMAFNVLA